MYEVFNLLSKSLSRHCKAAIADEAINISLPGLLHPAGRNVDAKKS
jgi:hypothetical protein